MYAADSGVAVNLTHMAVGDGNGNAVTPDEAQTALVREVYRAEVNRVYKPDAANYPALFAAELVIPASEGGFVMREVGIFDADGTLFAVGNLPETYKPQASEGAFSDTVVRLEFIATNSDVVSVVFYPNVAVVTQNWIANNVTAASIIPGGTTEQVLRKASNADGDCEWADPTEANVVVNTIEETQTLSDAQTLVTFSVVTNVGVAVYIDGARLPNDATSDGWQAHATDATKIILGQSYSAGSQLIAAQNEPASSLPDAMRKDQNLADVPDKALGRTNLGVYSKADTDQKAPAGMLAYFARNTAPSGWVKANGAELNRATYATLYSAIGTTFGSGNGATTFNVPDMRGEFLRGWDDARGIDAGRAFGSAQADELRAHTHGVPVRSWSRNHDGGATSRFDPNVTGTDTVTTKSTGGSETRPRNIAMLACIKY